MDHTHYRGSFILRNQPIFSFDEEKLTKMKYANIISLSEITEYKLMYKTC